jgi:RNA polymerase sigma-70 factor (ECF subfamily)
MEPQDLSSDALVRQVREGRVASFDALIKRYQLDVMRRVNLLFRDRSTVEDIVQEVFYSAFVHLDQYLLGTSFRNWIIGIAQNAVLQELRRSKRYGGRLERYAAIVEERVGTLSGDADDGRVKALLKCLEGIDAETAEMVRARYTEQRSLEQIADAAGRTVAAVRSYLHRARAQLRTCMERKGIWT